MYYELPFWREMPERKLSFSLEEDSFHSGISLQKGAFIVSFSFSEYQIKKVSLGCTFLFRVFASSVTLSSSEVCSIDQTVDRFQIS